MTGAGSGAVLAARAVTKVFDGTRALHEVDFEVRPGTVSVLFGENGAGKSTLMKILAGIESPTTGDVLLDGVPVAFAGPRAAADAGIAIIHQELSLCPNLSVVDNLFLARELTGRGGIDSRAQRERARAVLARLEEEIDPDALVGALRLGQQQIVEIARALLQDARLLIMDEPTSALSAPEIAVLFRRIRELTAAGVAIVYISHHLEEALEIADEVAVLRDGALVATAHARDVDLGWVVRRMVGRDQDELFPDHTPHTGEELLQVRDLAVADPADPERLAVGGISLTLRAGEVVGVYGLMGSGRTELLEAVAGRIPVGRGSVGLRGASIEGFTIRERISRGLVLVPEDRQRDGLVPTMSVGENLTLASVRAYVRTLWLSRRAEHRATAAAITDVTVKTPAASAPITALSGGNQQKVVIGKALLTSPRVLLLDEPSRGVDVGSKADVFALMTAQAEHGMAVLFTTSDAEEALHVPDRLLVLSRGRLAGEFRRGEITREELMRVADGAGADQDRRTTA